MFLDVKQSCLFFLNRGEIMMYLKGDNSAFKTYLKRWLKDLDDIYFMFVHKYHRYSRGFQDEVVDTCKKTLAEFEAFVAFNCKCYNQRFSYYIYTDIGRFYGRYYYLEKLRKTPAISDKV